MICLDGRLPGLLETESGQDRNARIKEIRRAHTCQISRRIQKLSLPIFLTLRTVRATGLLYL